MNYLSNVTRTRPGASGWALACILFAASFAARLALDGLLANSQFLTFFPAIVASTLLSGWRQGTAVLLASALTVWYFFLPPAGSLGLSGTDGIVSVLGFLLVGGFDILLVAALADAIGRLEAAVRTQESLFRELQHRVANNMQFVASMLQVARQDIRPETATEVLEQTAARVASMGLLHRRLYDSDAYARGLEPVLRDVLTALFQDMPVEVRLDIRSRWISLGQMTALVLLVAEAATNAIKHVFRPARGTQFEVTLSEVAEGRLLLTIRDDGPGIAPAAVAGQGGQKLGMSIMRALAGQLGGSLEMVDGPGTKLMVEFAPA